MALSLSIEGLDAGYGAVKALRGVSINVAERRDCGAARHQRQRQEHADEMRHGPGSSHTRQRLAVRSTARCAT